MKLIDLLVQELPKRGGWPDGEEFAYADPDGEIRFPGARGDFYPLVTVDNDDLSPEIGMPQLRITREQYESALAASQKPAWNGEGLPPVGCECEWRDKNVGCIPVTIKYISEQIVVMASPTNLCGVQELTEIAKDIICDKPQFRPLRTEADKKRDEALKSLALNIGLNRPKNDGDLAECIYDAIAAGKIHGVKLED